MKITLIEPRSPGFHVFSKVKLPRLGLPLLATLLKKKGHDVKIFVEEISSIDKERVLSSDLLGFSTITSTAPRAYELAEKFQRQSPTLIVVMGGPHVSFLPAEALKHADYCIIGEGERSFLALIQALSEGQTPDFIPGVATSRNAGTLSEVSAVPFCDLDSMPFPDLSLIQGYEDMSIMPVATSRGCPYGCRFCSVIQMFGRKYRFRPVDDVLDELEKLAPCKVFFYDDNFVAHPTRTKKLMQGIIERDIDILWGAQVRVDIADDPELLEEMYRAGGRVLYIGFESINPKTLKEYNKQFEIEDTVMAIQRIHSYKFRIHGMFVIGAENDNAETARRTVDFALEHSIDTLQLLSLIPLPGTPYFEDIRDSGRLLTPKWQYYDGHHVVYRPAQISPFRLQKELIKGMVRFYSLKKCIQLLGRFDIVNFYQRLYGWRTMNKWLADKKTQSYLSFLEKNYSRE